MSYEGLDSFLDNIDPMELILSSYYPNKEIINMSVLILEMYQNNESKTDLYIEYIIKLLKVLIKE
jgi:hypothetical protein